MPSPIAMAAKGRIRPLAAQWRRKCLTRTTGCLPIHDLSGIYDNLPSGYIHGGASTLGAGILTLLTSGLWRAGASAASQLRMEMSDLGKIPIIARPNGYIIRNYREGDEAELARLYRDARLDKDSATIVRKDIVEDPCFNPGRVFIAEKNGEIVGSASAWFLPEEPDAGFLHMVAVLNEHRGQKLGAVLVCEALRYTRGEHHHTQRLTTDDWREDAIKLYLRLGYYPLITDSSHVPRWITLGRKLDVPDVLERAKMNTRNSEAAFLNRLRNVINRNSRTWSRISGYVGRAYDEV